VRAGLINCPSTLLPIRENQAFRLEPLHHVRGIAILPISEVAASVPGDNFAPKCLPGKIVMFLADFPRARKLVENLVSDGLPYPLPPVFAEDEELGNVGREMSLISHRGAHEDETGELAIDTDDEGIATWLGPVVVEICVTKKAVRTDILATELAVVVAIQLQQIPQDRLVFARYTAKIICDPSRTLSS
jgi:hypothetical protein